MRPALLLSLAAALLGAPAAGAQTLPSQLIGGSVSLAIGGLTLRSNCYVNHSASFFQRNGLGSEALISFSDLTAGGTDLSGQAILTFTSATGGTIHFKQLPGVSDPPFINYSQVATSAARLNVNFTISFPGCSLPIHAVYDFTPSSSAAPT